MYTGNNQSLEPTFTINLLNLLSQTFIMRIFIKKNALHTLINSEKKTSLYQAAVYVLLPRVFLFLFFEKI